MTTPRSWPDIAGQELTPLDAGLPLSIHITPPAIPPAPLPESAERRWAELCTQNPRLHDGPMLSCSGFDGSTGRFTAAPDRFQRLVVQEGSFDLGVRMLGVKGLIIGRDTKGREHVLIARRGRQTRIYGDLWEIAPAGGIALPPLAATTPVTLGTREILLTLMEEAHEELGLDLREHTASDPAPVAIVRDELAKSVEIVVRVDWTTPVDPRRAVCTSSACTWEYSDSAWLARTEAQAFDARSADAIVGPMRAVLRWLTWT